MALVMKKREKIAVWIAGILILGVAIFNFGISPVMDKKALLERQVDAKKNVLRQVVQLGEEYQQMVSMQQGMTRIFSQREAGFTLFAFLEQIAVKAGVDKQIDYMKPSSGIDKQSKAELALVEMKLKGIKLSQLMSYLYLVETTENVVLVKRLAITSDGKNQHIISAVLQVETVKT
jgi:general secretion pathway protein M